MREDNLLGTQPKRFVVTTNSNHKLEIYLNLAGRMKLTGINQLWVADITYIRLRTEFVYLAVILDAFSRKVVGWSLDRTLAARLTITALEQALVSRQPQAGLVHHSDRGFQYACAEYVAILEKRGMIPSMSRPANPYDNASCESFMKTLKREEIYANQYNNLEHLRGNIEEFIERYYNRQRLHSALGYRSPEEFEQNSGTKNSADSLGATVEFVVNNGADENQVSPRVSTLEKRDMLEQSESGGAMGRPSCESSLLGIPEAKFFSRKAAASKNPSSKGKMDAFRKRWASPQMGVGEGIQTPSLPPTPPSLLCSGEGPILVHKFRARVHLRKIEFLSEKWGAPQDSNAVLFPKPLLLPRHVGMPSIESETVSNKFVPAQGFTPNSREQYGNNLRRKPSQIIPNHTKSVMH
jgi:transposase InsO family protein